MIFLTSTQLIMIHEMLINATGGSFGIRDTNILDSAINSPLATLQGEDLYPSVIEKATRLGFGIVNNHPFVDGNKRTGLLAMLTVLELNDIFLKYTDNELVDIGLRLAGGNMTLDELLQWLKEHL